VPTLVLRDLYRLADRACSSYRVHRLFAGARLRSLPAANICRSGHQVSDQGIQAADIGDVDARPEGVSGQGNRRPVP
jgi:hypothetical protein